MIVYNNKSDLTNVYLGNTNIAKVYIGTHQVYPSSTPPTPSYTAINYIASRKLNVTKTTFTPTATAETYDSTTSAGTIEFNANVTAIGNVAFTDETNLISVTIPNSVTTIGDSAFNNCSSLQSITIPDGVTNIGNAVFNNCTGLTSCTLGDSLTSIGSQVFQNCSNLTGITIPSGITTIGMHTFDGCSSLQSITIPDGVTNIGDSAFNNCNSLQSITIPSGVTNIGDYALTRCSSLQSITVNTSNPPTLGSSVFAMTNNCPILVPCQSLSLYLQEWAEYASRISCIPTPSYQWVSYVSGDTVPTATTVYGVRIYPLYDSNYNVTFSGSNGDYIRLYPDGFSDWAAVDENGTPINISRYRIRPGYAEYEIPFSDLGMGGMNIISPTTIFKDDIDLYVTN